jgi:hypothetical protein
LDWSVLRREHGRNTFFKVRVGFEEGKITNDFALFFELTLLRQPAGQGVGMLLKT